MSSGSSIPAAGPSSTTSSAHPPRVLIITDQTSLARALEQHVSIIFPDAECRIHAPLHSGRLHRAFIASGYDAVLLDDKAERGLGSEWLESLLNRAHFPPVVYIAPSDNPARATQVLKLGAIECIARERIDNRKLANALLEGVSRRRHESALLRTSTHVEEQARFGPITILGHRFVQELAVGGTSLVYLAESERAGEMVVLKVLRDDTGKDDSLHFSRFLQEYELISKIRHPNVVRILDLGIADDHAYIAMEYFPRGDLRSHIAKGMRSTDAVKALIDMASALEVVHTIGVLHRDLKPGNVMVRSDGSFALIDFGLAKHCAVEVDITAAGQIFGTPYYMSPEQGHGQKLDERSDLYSLGVIFYEMLTGKKPFLAANPMAVIYQHANAPRPRLDAELSRYQPVLDRLLAQSAAERFASANELLVDLHALNEAHA
jgi:eukaryotic-like serine/threonine-protein kinase